MKENFIDALHYSTIRSQKFDADIEIVYSSGWQRFRRVGTLVFGLIFAYIYGMKSPNKSKTDKSRREEILKSLLASFKIEGIDISAQVAAATLKKLELKLGK